LSRTVYSIISTWLLCFLAKWKECVHSVNLAWLCIKTLVTLLCTKMQRPETSCFKAVSNHISYFVTIHCYSQCFNP
jgi:ABC-type spermidine/putrescine transport system permease subunit II